MTTVTNTSSLPAWQTEAWQDLLAQTQAQNEVGLPVYQGPRVAAWTPEQIAANQGVIDFAQGPQAGANVNAAAAANLNYLDPNFLTNQAPGQAGIRAGISQDVGRLLTETALPAIRGQSILAGGLGGTRQGVAEGLAVGRSSDSLANQLAALDLAMYNTNLGVQQKAVNDAAGVTGAQLLPSQLLMSAGGAQQTQNQAELAAAQALFQDQANVPYFALDQLRSSLGLLPTTTNSSSSTRGGSYDSQDWLGAAVGGALLGQSEGWWDISDIWRP